MRSALVMLAVTLATACGRGYYILNTPQDSTGIMTSNAERGVFVAGCLPQNRPHIDGAWGDTTWICNDVSIMKAKVLMSPFVSCETLFDNGVVDAFIITEVSNRHWSQFSFSCRDLTGTGALGSRTGTSGPLVSFDGGGTVFSTVLSGRTLPIGILENQNTVTLRESLLQVGIMHLPADSVFAIGADSMMHGSFDVTPRIPPAGRLPFGVGFYSWLCPPGMVMTGAALGHIPHDDNHSTRPVFILGECRRLRHG